MGQIYFYKNEHAYRELRFSKSAFFGEEKGKRASEESRGGRGTGEGLGGEGPSAWSLDADCDSEPVPIIPLCAMYRCRDFARSRSRVANA